MQTRGGGELPQSLLVLKGLSAARVPYPAAGLLRSLRCWTLLGLPGVSPLLSPGSAVLHSSSRRAVCARCPGVTLPILVHLWSPHSPQPEQDQSRVRPSGLQLWLCYPGIASLCSQGLRFAARSETAGTAGQAVPGLAHSNLSRETSTANVPFCRWGVHECGFIEGLCACVALAVSNTRPPSASVPGATCPEGSRLGAALPQTPVRAVGGAGAAWEQ